MALQAVGWIERWQAAIWAWGWRSWAVLACGAGVIQWLFWRLLIGSVVPDRMHAKVIAVAGLVGVVALGAVIASLLLDGGEMARPWVLTALWGFIATTYVSVAHRMIPFFTASAVPMLRAWRPNWVLGLLLVAVVLEVFLQWMEWTGISGGQATRVWMLMRGLLELAIGSVIVWLALCGHGAKPEDPPAGHVARGLCPAWHRFVLPACRSCWGFTRVRPCWAWVRCTH